MDTRLTPPRKETALEIQVREQIEALQHKTVGQLREKYREVFGEESRSFHKQFLFRRIAWRLQANAEGGSGKALAGAPPTSLPGGMRPFGCGPSERTGGKSYNSWVCRCLRSSRPAVRKTSRTARPLGRRRNQRFGLRQNSAPRWNWTRRAKSATTGCPKKGELRLPTKVL